MPVDGSTDEGVDAEDDMGGYGIEMGSDLAEYSINTSHSGLCGDRILWGVGGEQRGQSDGFADDGFGWNGDSAV